MKILLIGWIIGIPVKGGGAPPLPVRAPALPPLVGAVHIGWIPGEIGVPAIRWWYYSLNDYNQGIIFDVYEVERNIKPKPSSCKIQQIQHNNGSF